MLLRYYLNMPTIKIGVADVRKEPRFESERDSQIIYGEEFNVLEDLGEYTKILCRDGVTGFVKTSVIGEEVTGTYKLKSFFDAGTIKLPFGSILSETDIKKYGIRKDKITEIDNYEFLVEDLSRRFMGVPYLWGGTSDFGFDCSGFVQRLYRFVGKELPRNSDQQRDFTKTVNGFKNARSGDLIFFKGHVALYLGEGNIIHANGHMASVSMNNLFDGSSYSRKLLDIFEKIGRVE